MLEYPYMQFDINDPLLHERLITGFNHFRRFSLDRKPHIKAYNKARNTHGEIVNAMVQYHQDGKFERRVSNDIAPGIKYKNLRLLKSDFDLNTREGGQAFYDMLIYKSTPSMSCITEDFIRDHRYKKPEKIEFLHSMLDSKLGLFEVTDINMEEGYAYLKDVFTGNECTIIDIGLSGQPNYDDNYLYTRIITYRDINFGSGLNLIFNKKEQFIKNFIQKHKKNFTPDMEFVRFTELYNHYSQNKDKIRVVAT